MALLIVSGILAAITAALIWVLCAAEQTAERRAAFRIRVQSELKCDELMMGFFGEYVGVRFADHKIILGIEKPSADFLLRSRKGSAADPSASGVTRIAKKNGFCATYDFQRVTAVEIVENGVTMTNTNRGSQFIGAAVGELLLGGVGAIVGGSSGSTRTTNNVKSLHLKITVDDQTNPIWLICFFRSSTTNGTPPGNSVLETGRASLERMHAHIRNAIFQSQAPKASVVLSRSSADEIRKLWELRQEGILTEDEYQHQKRRLVTSPGDVRSLEDQA
jgi:uncharacterized membrane protein YsdA (DUF1294 family)